MTDLYGTLSMIKTAIANSIGERLVSGDPAPVNYVGMLSTIADEVNSNLDLMEELESLSVGEVEDVGVDVLSAGSDLMLFPLWLYTFIPHGTELRNIRGDVVVKGEDDVDIWAENWVNMGVIID